MMGYLYNEEKTTEVFTEDDFLRTGDLVNECRLNLLRDIFIKLRKLSFPGFWFGFPSVNNPKKIFSKHSQF
jgi:hypothetical protein